MDAEDVPTMDEAIAELIGDRRTGDLDRDLFEAGRATKAIRERNSLLGGVVLGALQARGHSLRAIEDETGIPKSNIPRWALPPSSGE